ncbi:Putative major facilitator superfamily, MFS transporter superfamily [Colletotrichum destructivum]|uniref:Major facilitator superfamily, MFS transporter superfamily n=1 Tax=Colletotrichum destructivum TaxID=34406 RepID=A0AAX4IBW4_9PEZI|nr:Putative major facilitator superfamily, MFS transporter superfamily [Colletotrichum destructivum]
MDVKDFKITPSNAIGLESLRPPPSSSDVSVDDKQDAPINGSASVPPTLSDALIREAHTQTDSGSTDVNDAKLRRRARWALFVMAFFMGDVQDGIGPFLGVYLQQHGWSPGLRGSVSTASGVATIIATAPIGALIDATKYKRLLVSAFALLVGVSQGLNLLTTHPALVFSTQIVSAVAGTSMMPLLVALTLGVCSRHPGSDDAAKGKNKHSFRALNGRNQAANHAGNMVSAGLAAVLGERFGLTAVFWLVMAFCAATMGSVLLLPERAIDHAAARGGPSVDDDMNTTGGPQDIQERDRSGTDEEAERGGASQTQTREAPIANPKEKKKKRFLNSTLGLLLRNKPLVVVAVTVFSFHLGNAAILFLYGQALVAAGEGNPASTTGLTVIIAQGTMVIVSVLTSWLAGRSGYWFAVLLSYAALPVRAAVAGRFIKSWGVWPVQILDGVGAGIQSVAIPGLLAVMMAGTGRVNVTFGIVGGVTRQTGAAISHSLGGWMAEARGYSFALYLSGVFPLVSLAIWLGFYKMLRPVMDRKPSEGVMLTV